MLTMKAAASLGTKVALARRASSVWLIQTWTTLQYQIKAWSRSVRSSACGQIKATSHANSIAFLEKFITGYHRHFKVLVKVCLVLNGTGDPTGGSKAWKQTPSFCSPSSRTLLTCVVGSKILRFCHLLILIASLPFIAHILSSRSWSWSERLQYLILCNLYIARCRNGSQQSCSSRSNTAGPVTCRQLRHAVWRLVHFPLHCGSSTRRRLGKLLLNDSTYWKEGQEFSKPHQNQKCWTSNGGRLVDTTLIYFAYSASLPILPQEVQQFRSGPPNQVAFSQLPTMQRPRRPAEQLAIFWYGSENQRTWYIQTLPSIAKHCQTLPNWFLLLHSDPLSELLRTILESSKISGVLLWFHQQLFSDLFSSTWTLGHFGTL